MIVAIHQPNFLPWLGFFDKIVKSDTFVLYDSCRNDSHLGWTKRVRITKGHSTQWLTIRVRHVHKDENGLYPRLSKHELFDVISDKRQHLRTISAEYRKTPYYNHIMPFIEKLYGFKTNSITEFNIHCIKAICAAVGFQRKLVKGSNLEIRSAKNEANADMTEKVGGTIYLSGQGGKEYMDEGVYLQKGITILYQNFEHPVYPQYDTKEFIRGLSVIDALMNVGFDGVKNLLSP